MKIEPQVAPPRLDLRLCYGAVQRLDQGGEAIYEERRSIRNTFAIDTIYNPDPTYQ